MLFPSEEGERIESWLWWLGSGQADALLGLTFGIIWARPAHGGGGGGGQNRAPISKGARMGEDERKIVRENWERHFSPETKSLGAEGAGEPGTFKSTSVSLQSCLSPPHPTAQAFPIA